MSVFVSSKNIRKNRTKRHRCPPRRSTSCLQAPAGLVLAGHRSQVTEIRKIRPRARKLPRLYRPIGARLVLHQFAHPAAYRDPGSPGGGLEAPLSVGVEIDRHLSHACTSNSFAHIYQQLYWLWLFLTTPPVGCPAARTFDFST